MSTALAPQQPGALALDAETMKNLMAGGDCSRLSDAQKNAYYMARCDAAGLDYRAQPFAFMRLNGKEVLYAQKAATDQLAAKHGLRTTIVSQTTEEGIRVVTVRAEAKDGRVTEEIGALPVGGLKGEALSNALMKCVTKAKRRAVLSICGLGMLDETEVESIATAEPVRLPPKRADEVQPPHVVAAAEVLQAEVVETKPAKKETPAHVRDLWDRAGKEYGEKGREPKWRVAAVKVFGAGKVPPVSEWTEDDTKDVEGVLFAPRDVPF